MKASGISLPVRNQAPLSRLESKEVEQAQKTPHENSSTL